MEPSPHFLLLAAALLEEILPDSVPDATLARLHAVFGSMLTSALQLVDRREVVRVDMNGRHLFQISSSSGVPYSLFLDLAADEADLSTDVVATRREDKGVVREGEVTDDSLTSANEARVRAAAARLAHMYCPCAGYAFNALDGRQVVCKHILAVLVAHRLGRVVDTRVGVSAAPTLLGLTPAISAHA